MENPINQNNFSELFKESADSISFLKFMNSLIDQGNIKNEIIEYNNKTISLYQDRVQELDELIMDITKKVWVSLDLKWYQFKQRKEILNQINDDVLNLFRKQRKNNSIIETLQNTVNLIKEHNEIHPESSQQ